MNSKIRIISIRLCCSDPCPYYCLPNLKVVRKVKMEDNKHDLTKHFFPCFPPTLENLYGDQYDYDLLDSIHQVDEACENFQVNVMISLEGEENIVFKDQVIAVDALGNLDIKPLLSKIFHQLDLELNGMLISYVSPSTTIDHENSQQLPTVVLLGTYPQALKQMSKADSIDLGKGLLKIVLSEPAAPDFELLKPLIEM